MVYQNIPVPLWKELFKERKWTKMEKLCKKWEVGCLKPRKGKHVYY